MGTATMPAATALGIPYPLQVSYQFDGAEELLHSLHALFGLLARANTPRHCPQASGFGKQLCTAAGTDSAHILSIALSLASALQTGRSTLAIAGVWSRQNTLAYVLTCLVRDHRQFCDLALPIRRILQEGPLQSF